MLNEDDQRILLIAYALSGTAYEAADEQVDTVASRAIKISSVVMAALRAEQNEREKNKPPPAERNPDTAVILMNSPLRGGDF